MATIEESNEFQFAKPPLLAVGRGDSDSDSEDEAEERKGGWSEVFFDLVYVVTVSKLGDAFREGSSLSITSYLLLFVPIFLSWSSTTLYSTRFQQEDMYHTWMYSLIMMGVVGMGMHCEAGLGDNRVGYALSAMGINLVFAFMYARIAHALKGKARKLALTHIAAFLVGIVILLLIVLMQESYSDLLFFIYSASQLLLFAISFTYPFRLGVIVEHYTERFGCFTMLVMGETAFGVTQTASPSSGWRFYFCAAAGLLLLLNFKLLYFDVDPKQEDGHALMGRFRAMWWELAHIVGLASLALLGSGLELAVLAADSGTSIAGDTQLLCGAAAGYFFTLGVIQWSHRHGAGVTGKTRRLVGLSLRFVSALVSAVLPFWSGSLSPLVVVGILLVMSFILVSLDLFGRFYVAIVVSRRVARKRWGGAIGKHAPVASVLGVGAGKASDDSWKSLLTHSRRLSATAAKSEADRRSSSDAVEIVSEEGESYEPPTVDGPPPAADAPPAKKKLTGWASVTKAAKKKPKYEPPLPESAAPVEPDHLLPPAHGGASPAPAPSPAGGSVSDATPSASAVTRRWKSLKSKDKLSGK
eukprot:PLAT8598.1.p1 GENE.PLAT8598.1~~PLAT8598.1.p1  ORF type:complete len:583 (-),score=304.21 PLAT8598.1:67-1815(-)